MTESVKELREIAAEAKAMLYVGAIDLKEAKKRCQPYIDAVNEKSKELAKKYNQRYKKVTVNGFLR